MNLLDLFNGLALGAIIGFLYLMVLNWFDR